LIKERLLTAPLLNSIGGRRPATAAAADTTDCPKSSAEHGIPPVVDTT
jgi:hypothetical protein